jgi:DNA-binding PadR family transcriptional regulator
MGRKKDDEARRAERRAEPSAMGARRSVGRAGSRTGARERGSLAPTTPDLVVLSLLSEHPMHGYQVNLELERREIHDWAEVSRPQVYYSLEKLARAGLLRASESDRRAGGPERTTFETTKKGREALADALEREAWTTERDHPAFLTWLALSWQARPGVFRKQLNKRREFLVAELAREKKTLLSIYAEVGHKFHEAVWMVGLMIEQLKTEIRWNRQLERSLKRRAPALFPPSVVA